MKVELLFDRDDALCYTILQRLFREHDQQITANRLIGDYDLSPYRLNKAITTINNDLMDVVQGADPVFVDEPEKGLLQAHRLTTLVLQRLGLIYLKRSVIFAVFEYHFIYANRYSKVDYMKSRYLSRTPFYHAETRLGQVIDQFGLTLNDQPTTTEFDTRLKLFQIYYTAYNGLGDPFSDLDAAVDAIFAALTPRLEIEMTPTQSSKLQIFTKLWLARLRDHRPLNTIPAAVSAPDFAARLAPLAATVSHAGNPTPNAIELQYFGLFLLTQGYLPETLAAHEADIAPAATQLADTFVQLVNQAIPSAALTRQEAQQLHEASFTIQVQFDSFYVEPTTFIDLDQTKFFQQTYPVFDRIVTRFIAHLAAQAKQPLQQADQVNLYFSYMFAMINHLALDDTTDQVYVCVDFSQGRLYTDYIVKTLRAFQNARIIVEHKLSAKTDIYLSDFYSNHVTQQQIIWQNPPTAVDWTELADTIVIIKKRKLAALDPAVTGLPAEETHDDTKGTTTQD